MGKSDSTLVGEDLEILQGKSYQQKADGPSSGNTDLQETLKMVKNKDEEDFHDLRKMPKKIATPLRSSKSPQSG